MEGYFEYRPKQRAESPLERNYLDSRLLEDNTWIPAHELQTLRYSRSQDAFSPVPETAPKKGIEVLYHEGTSTLIVPSPRSGTLSIQDLAQMSLPVD